MQELGERLSIAELREWLAVERIRAKPDPQENQPMTLEQARATMKSSVRRGKT